MSGKPVAFQDVASNIFNYTIQTSKEQCKKAEAKLKQVSPAAQDETYARVGAVGNGGVKNATLGREALAKDLNYAGLSQQFCTVSSDVATCIEIQKLFAKNASIDSTYSTLSPYAQREIEASYPKDLCSALAAYIQKYDPVPSVPDVALDEAQVQEELIFLAHQFRGDYNILRRSAPFLESNCVDRKETQARALEIYDRLSPFAQWLLAEASPGSMKEAMAKLFGDFVNNTSARSIMAGMKHVHLGAMQQLLVEAYLSYPRHAAFAFLKSNSDGSQEALVHYLSNSMESLHRQPFDELKNLISRLAHANGVS